MAGRLGVGGLPSFLAKLSAGWHNSSLSITCGKADPARRTFPDFRLIMRLFLPIARTPVSTNYHKLAQFFTRYPHRWNT
jgi:hypothetical protein